ncbi:hypothetical protein IJ425_00735 [bacterium]|nr:hypothetical protein [bacterium]
MNIDSIRQPTPNVVGQNSNAINQSATKKEAKKFNLPKVGVVDVPTISKTPLVDTLVKKEQENPQITYKLTPKSNRGFNLQNLFSLTIVGCSIGALLSLIKKK